MIGCFQFLLLAIMVRPSENGCCCPLEPTTSREEHAGHCCAYNGAALSAVQRLLRRFWNCNWSCLWTF
jgi:hypothetical protein